MTPFVYVLWNDAEHPSTGEWHMAGELPNVDLTAEAGGFLVERNAQRIRIAVSVAGRGTDSEQYTGIMTIPMGCVIKIIEFPPGEGRKIIYKKRGK